MLRGAWLGFFLLVAGCGKVGEPLPPFIRIPEPVMDLAAGQTGHDVVLTWTNPARYIDGSAATDLGRVQIRADGAVIANVNVNGPGQPQSYSLPAAGQRTFTLQLETTRGRLSDLSNSVSITPVDVPGRVARLRSVVDQRRIAVQWDPPQEHPELAGGYVVVRTDTPGESQLVMGMEYIDDRYEQGKVFTYHVTPVRITPERTIPGVGPEALEVTAVDKTPPQIPTGLDIQRSDMGAFLVWAANDETDLAGYRVFRSDRPDGGFMPVADGVITTSSHFDPTSRPGLYYAVSAIDEFRNESARSAPFPVR
jgi:hypothetical protein